MTGIVGDRYHVYDRNGCPCNMFTADEGGGVYACQPSGNGHIIKTPTCGPSAPVIPTPSPNNLIPKTLSSDTVKEKETENIMLIIGIVFLFFLISALD